MCTSIYLWRRLEVLRYLGAAARRGSCRLFDHSRTHNGDGASEQAHQKDVHDYSEYSRAYWMLVRVKLVCDCLRTQLFFCGRVAGYWGKMLQLELVLGWSIELVVLIAHFGHDAVSPSFFRFIALHVVRLVDMIERFAGVVQGTRGLDVSMWPSS